MLIIDYYPILRCYWVSLIFLIVFVVPLISIIYMILYLALGMIFLGVICSIGTVVGLIKLKNLYSVLHAGAVNDAIGVCLSCLGVSLLFFVNHNIVAGIKAFLVVILVYIINPITSHIITKVIYFFDKEKMEKDV